jgi:penicillin amidase
MTTKAPTTDDGLRPRLVRDEHGVPHVQAATEEDLYRGLGYCHAADRGMQMLLGRIVGEGRCSELLASSDQSLATDRLFRRLNLGGDAHREIDKLSEDDRRLFSAYCEGINEAFGDRTPWELRLAGYRPTPWTPADSVLLSRMAGYVALAQSQGDMERLLVELVQAGVQRDHLDELFPDLLDGLDEELLRSVRLGNSFVEARWNPALAPAMASNNWAVCGGKTISGAAILSNDPHLEINRLPQIWYEVVLELGDRYCIAATMPGLPALLLGRNNDLAWGATYSFMDAVDSWIEDCRDGAYRRMTDGGESWEPFRVRTEVIKRKNKPDVSVTFHENAHGVLDGDPNEPGLYLATHWSGGAESGAGSLSAMFRMLWATNVHEGMDLVGQIETAWNWVLGDRGGNIGYQMSGRMPRRRDGWNGLLPQPGWDPANDWRGFVPPDELPRTVNPDSGFIATANNDLNHLGQARPINLPMASYRAERIERLLEDRNDWDVQALGKMQLDVYSTQAERFMNVLRPLLPTSANGNLLRNWDCRYDAESKGASLFETFYRQLLVDVFGVVCGDQVMRFLIGETGVLADFFTNFDEVLLRDYSVWYRGEAREVVWTRVANRVLQGETQPWGARQQVWMKHLLLGGRYPTWLGFDRGPLAVAGGRATISQGQIYKAGGRETSFAPSFRFVTALNEPVSRTALAGGPSDRRFSRWYVSDLDNWKAGRLKELKPFRSL